ncbi:MAG: efflux RND transporter permease subunit [Burkholderiales bacterium]
MMRWIVGISLKYRYIVTAAAVAMMYFGIEQLRDTPIDVFPEFAPPVVEIQTPSLGLSAAEVEALVTIPLENALYGVSGLDVMRSKSVPQLSSVKMFFEPGIDLLRARQFVHERLAIITPKLPTWAMAPSMLQPLSSTARCMKIGLSSKELSLIDLSMIAYWKIRPRLLQVPGVANIAIWGERKQMLFVQVDPKRLREHGLALDEVTKATAEALSSGRLPYSTGAMIGSGGFLDTPNQRIPIRHSLSIVTPADLAEVTFTSSDGKALRLGDVTTVVEGHQPMVGDAIINDGPGLLLIVEKFPWGNTLELTRGVEKALAALQPGLRGVEVDSQIFRPATFIELSIHNLTVALIISSVLVIPLLFAFLYEWRSTFISATVIPLSLMAAALVLVYFGATINTMLLAGFVIAIGPVVDDAIVDVENIVRRLRQRRLEGGQASIARVVLEASFEVRHAIIFATLIVVVALVPIFFMEGLSGAFFRPLALSYVLAVGASMLVALTVTPAMSMLLLRNVPLEHHKSPLTAWLQVRYTGLLARVVRTPRPAYLMVGVMFLTGGIVWPLLGQELLPAFKERDFLMHWLTKPGTSWPEMNRITIQGSKELRTIPGVRNFGAHIGQALMMDEVVGIDFGENWISVEPAADYDRTLAKIQEVVDGYPGIYRDVQTYLKERIREVLTGASESIVIRIFGDDLEILRRKAAEVRQAIAGTAGLAELHVELQTEVPQIDIEVDLEAAKRYGVKPGDVRRSVTTLMASLEAGDLYMNGKIYDVRVWSTPETRNSLTDIRKLPIDTPRGGHVQLKDVAEVRLVPAPNVIKREGLKRRIDVSANVHGRDLGSVVEDVEQALDTVDFPAGYYPELLGEYAEREAAEDRLLAFAAAVVIAIFFLLYIPFRSFRLGILSFVLLPSALVGGVLAALFGGGVISLGSLVGFLTILGIAVRNGILMITHFQHLEEKEGETFGLELVLRGARERLAPILMTSIATGLALAPLVVAGQIPGNEIEHPMAIVILGGLVSATLVNLFVLPSLYLRFGQPRGPGPEGAQAAGIGH